MQGSNRDKVCKDRLLDSVGEGESGVIWENSSETCILPYVTQMTSASLIHEAGHLKLVLWDSPEGWGREGGGRGFRIGGHMHPVADSCRCVAKTTTIR